MCIENFGKYLNNEDFEEKIGVNNNLKQSSDSSTLKQLRRSCNDNHLEKNEKSAGDNSNISNKIGINNNFNSEQFHYYNSLISDIIFIIIKNIIEYNENKQLISQLIRKCPGSWEHVNCGLKKVFALYL